jgi:hypothetical protein
MAPLPLPVGIEETQHALGLLKGLDQSVQQNPIETSIAKLDAILVVFDEGVHGGSRVVRYQEHTAMNASQGNRIAEH